MSNLDVGNPNELIGMAVLSGMATGVAVKVIMDDRNAGRETPVLTYFIAAYAATVFAMTTGVLALKVVSEMSEIYENCKPN